ncbi:MAG: hypothetical protein ACU84Q_00305 [Gammaproteobacteria bacterium]
MVNFRREAPQQISDLVVQPTDRRSKARVILNCKALIRLHTGMTFPAELRDISATAAQVLCDARYAYLIDPSGTGDSLRESLPLELAVVLPGDEGASGFKTRCRVKYCSAATQNQSHRHMLLGLKFLGIDFSLMQKLDPILDINTSQANT